jgi:hypothetical protein
MAEIQWSRAEKRLQTAIADGESLVKKGKRLDGAQLNDFIEELNKSVITSRQELFSGVANGHPSEWTHQRTRLQEQARELYGRVIGLQREPVVKLG